MVPADERALRYLQGASLPEPSRERLLQLVRRAQAIADGAGAELSAEFGREHVGLIVACNQFLRLDKAGELAGRVELFLDPPAKQALAAAGFTLHEHPNYLLRTFGWVVVDPLQGDLAALEQAVAEAFRKAQAAKKR